MRIMRKLLYTLLVAGAVLFTSCESFTDIQPKGMNLLSTTTELEMLLNAEMTMMTTDMRLVAGDAFHGGSHIPTLLSQPGKTKASIIASLDDTSMDLLAELTPSDGDYTNWYECIGRIANPILMQADAAEGDEKTKQQLKAEALTLRAYCHWLLVNKFAKAYNPATAETDPGIPYLTHEWDISVPTEKLTVKEVYENIIKDLDDAIALNALPDVNINRMRMNKGAAYAAKALAHMSMQDYANAAAAAKNALAVNDGIMNYKTSLTMMQGVVMGGKYPCIFRPVLECEEDYFFTYDRELMYALTPEAMAYFEPGHVCKDKMANFNMMFDHIMDYGAMTFGLPGYIVNYDQISGWNQCGMKTTHMYLILAECAVANNNIDEAMGYLDEIRENRIDDSVYAPLKGAVTSEAEAIEWVKRTSHGECVYSIYNYIQKKRWNELPKYRQTWSRVVMGQTYSIEPGSPLWIFPFPMNAVNNNPNLLPHNYESAQ